MLLVALAVTCFGAVIIGLADACLGRLQTADYDHPVGQSSRSLVLMQGQAALPPTAPLCAAGGPVCHPAAGGGGA